MPHPRSAELIRSLVNGMGIVQDHVALHHLHALDWVDVQSALRPIPRPPPAGGEPIPWPNNSGDLVPGSPAAGRKIGSRRAVRNLAGDYWGIPPRLPPEANLLALALPGGAPVAAGNHPPPRHLRRQESHPNFVVGGMACSINLDNQLTINAVRLDELRGTSRRPGALSRRSTTRCPRHRRILQRLCGHRRRQPSLMAAAKAPSPVRGASGRKGAGWGPARRQLDISSRLTR
jgi:Ni,Fe-hydrogenase I large subunit